MLHLGIFVILMF